MEEVNTANHYEVDDTFRDCENCPEMVVVPAGSFLMGSPPDDKDDREHDGPQHKVTISAAFAIGKYAVTRKQYREFAKAVGDAVSDYWQEPHRIKFFAQDFTQTDDHPVVCVDWNEAKAYTAWLSKKTGQNYRLLSESEWEYVARAGTTTRYYFGHTISPSQANYDKNNNGTVPVGNYPANEFGLHDIHGNVWEWVEDCWHSDYNDAPTDSSAWTKNCDDEDYRDNRDNSRVLRGGAWDSIPWFLRSAYRFRRLARDNFVNVYVGFRLARDLTP